MLSGIHTVDSAADVFITRQLKACFFFLFHATFRVFYCAHVVTILVFSVGTSAQQLDATFSTSASLEIFELDLSDPSLDMKSCATFSSSHRYGIHFIFWGRVPVAQADLEVTSSQECPEPLFCTVCVRIMGKCHHCSLVQCLWLNPGLCAGWASTLPNELHPGPVLYLCL